jgi:hypothetical protein
MGLIEFEFIKSHHQRRQPLYQEDVDKIIIIIIIIKCLLYNLMKIVNQDYSKIHIVGPQTFDEKDRRECHVQLPLQLLLPNKPIWDD